MSVISIVKNYIMKKIIIPLDLGIEEAFDEAEVKAIKNVLVIPFLLFLILDIRFSLMHIGLLYIIYNFTAYGKSKTKNRIAFNKTLIGSFYIGIWVLTLWIFLIIL